MTSPIKRLLLALLMLLISGTDLFPQEFVPYPERFKRLVQSISFSPDGKEVYFTLPHREYLEAQGKEVTETTPRLAIYSAPVESDAWGEPNLISFGGVYKEYEPTISPDGNIILFNSDRPLSGTTPLQKNNIWFSEKVNGQWTEPRYIPGINTQLYEESYATISADGQVFFVSETPVGDKFEYSIYTTKFKGTATEPAKKVVELDQPQGSADPLIAPDGSYIIFTKFGENWRETCDLYISFKNKNSWSAPVALDDLNTPGPDYAAAVSPDQQWLYYRKGGRFTKVEFQPILQKLR